MIIYLIVGMIIAIRYQCRIIREGIELGKLENIVEVIIIIVFWPILYLMAIKQVWDERH